MGGGTEAAAHAEGRDALRSANEHALSPAAHDAAYAAYAVFSGSRPWFAAAYSAYSDYAAAYADGSAHAASRADESLRELAAVVRRRVTSIDVLRSALGSSG